MWAVEDEVWGYPGSARTSLEVSVPVDRGLRLPQLHQPNGEHDRRGINFLLPCQHSQKGDSLGQKLLSISARAQFQQQSKGIPCHFLRSPGRRFHR